MENSKDTTAPLMECPLCGCNDPTHGPYHTAPLRDDVSFLVGYLRGTVDFIKIDPPLWTQEDSDRLSRMAEYLTIAYLSK